MSPYSIPSKSASIGSEQMAQNLNMAPPSNQQQNVNKDTIPPPPSMPQNHSDESNLTADINSYKLLDSKAHLGLYSYMSYIIHPCVVYRVYYIQCIINFIL